MVLVGKIRKENTVEMRKSQLRHKLGCWEVIRGFSSTLCQWQVISSV